MWMSEESAASNIAAHLRKDVSTLYEDHELDAQLAKVTTVTDLLDALLALERLVAGSITAQVREYDLDLPIGDQKVDHSASMRARSQLLFTAYHRVVSDPHAMSDVIKLLDGVDGQFASGANPSATPYKPTAAKYKDVLDDSKRAEVEFSGSCLKFVLLFLAASSRLTAGARLIERLAGSKAAVYVQPVYKESPASMLLAEAPVASAYCVSNSPNAELGTRLTDITPPKPSADRLAGTFNAPVWLSNGASAGELTCLSFHPGPGGQTVEAALRAVLAGSLSFDTEYRPFYTPPRIEVLHEIVHAIHNANGENRNKIKLVEHDDLLWDGAEEAWTIAFDDTGENALGSDVGIPARLGHGGLYLDGLAATGDLAGSTLRQLSRDPRKPDTGKTSGSKTGESKTGVKKTGGGKNNESDKCVVS